MKSIFLKTNILLLLFWFVFCTTGLTVFAQGTITSGGTYTQDSSGNNTYSNTGSYIDGSPSSLTPDASGMSEASIDAELRKTINAVDASTPRTSQAYTYANSSSTGGVAGGGAGGITKGAGACVAEKLLATIMTSTISQAVGKVTNVIDLALGNAAAVFTVPTADWGTVKWDTMRIKEQTQFQSAAHTGTTIGFGGFNAIAVPGWDAVGYCIVNSIIDYIANSTIAWARSGFKGNPAFIDNPGQFFKQLADVEASSFLQGLAYGVLGQNICEPFRAQIVLTIAQDYIGTQGNYTTGGGAYGGYNTGGYSGGAARTNGTFGGCTLDDIQGNFKAFLKGDFRRGGWDSWFKISQVQSNNPYSTYLNLSAQLTGSIERKKVLADKELNWGNGFLSFRKCEEKTAAKDQSNCPITTPGKVIQGQLEKTLGIAKDRLVLAQKFDQVIAEVVKALISTALNKVLDGTQ